MKNIKSFCGKPLIFWNLNELEKTQEIDKVFVATDCNEISSVVKSFNFSKVRIYNRLKKNATDTATTESVMLEFIKEKNIKEKTIFLLIQATSPLTSSQDFSSALKLFNNNKIDSLLSCSEIKRFFWTKEGNPINYDYRNRPRRQDFDGQYIENGAFYINSVFNIKKYKNRLSGKIGVYKMPEYKSVEIDEDVDWIIAESLMKKYFLPKNIEKKQIKLFLADIDGTLTDSGMYYSENGDELKKFSTYDGKAFQLLREHGILTGIITSEKMALNRKRAEKLKLDYDFHGIQNKLDVVKKLCEKINISLSEVAYIGDDINDFELLSNVGICACPVNAVSEIKNISGIIKLTKKGGEGAVREFVESLL